MNKEEIFCLQCESEFYVESENDIIYCITCGEEIGYDEDGIEELDEWDE